MIAFYHHQCLPFPCFSCIFYIIISVFDVGIEKSQSSSKFSSVNRPSMISSGIFSLTNSLIFCQMHGDGKVIGVLTVQSFKKHAYTNYHLNLVNTLASYTGAALNNAALYDTLEQKVEERTLELEEKNKDIMSSINYAKRIQNGILPSASFMSQLLPNSFVFYRPRDIVSGDFYWVERSAGKVFFAVVDCTGHGVPGALMSIIGKNILDQAVNEKGLDDPSMILAFLRAGLRFAFSADADDVDNGIEDGMDLGICILDKESQSIEYAGANINLHLVRNGDLTVIKGDKSGVSASDFAIKHFECHSLDVFENEPIKKNHPLVKLPNIVLAPHIGSSTKETRIKMAEITVKNLNLGINGKKPTYSVGY